MKKKQKQNKPLVEGVDYTLSAEGLFILSKSYLLKRGYCCGNGCKHCPYPKKEKK